MDKVLWSLEIQGVDNLLKDTAEKNKQYVKLSKCHVADPHDSSWI